MAGTPNWGQVEAYLHAAATYAELPPVLRKAFVAAAVASLRGRPDIIVPGAYPKGLSLDLSETPKKKKRRPAKRERVHRDSLTT